ncbi:MAG TPA: 7-cyano-7-deazaguanine synthase [Terriglobales bacterium]|nr:7-cyano-7-deazaguanine synthase [Terriglobales bacterium]
MKTGLLLSGGIDSSALAAWKRPNICLTIDYGQFAADAEIYSASQICQELGLSHEVVRVDCRALGSGDMTGTPPLPCAPVPEWWPFRNQLLVTLAAVRLSSDGVEQIMIGAVRSDFCHRDGTAQFFDLLDAALAYQELGIRVSAPAISMSSVELVKSSGITPSHLALTHSCHTGRHSCGRCRGCQKHFQVFQHLGLERTAAG